MRGLAEANERHDDGPALLNPRRLPSFSTVTSRWDTHLLDQLALRSQSQDANDPRKNTPDRDVCGLRQQLWDAPFDIGLSGLSCGHNERREHRLIR